MENIKNSIDRIKSECLTKIKDVLLTIPKDYLDNEFKNKFNTANKTFTTALEVIEYKISRIRGNNVIFHIPLSIVLDEENPLSKRYMRNQLKVVVIYHSDNRMITYDVEIENLEKRTLETLLNYVDCLTPFISNEKKKEMRQTKLAQEFKIGNYFKFKSFGHWEYYVITDTPYYKNTFNAFYVKGVKVDLDSCRYFGTSSCPSHIQINQQIIPITKDELIEEMEKKNAKTLEKYRKSIRGLETQMRHWETKYNEFKEHILNNKNQNEIIRL